MTNVDEIPPKDHPVWKIILYSLALLAVLYGASDPSVLVGLI
tara:strand:- start:467 stop:592 length:126 start_codon:yes stop_codon:yes gene_type:complete